MRPIDIALITIPFVLITGLLAAPYVMSRDDAGVASRNLSKAADKFEVMRRVVFMDGITDNHMLEIVGLCSISDRVSQLEVTCRTGDNTAKKHFLGLSDNVTYFVEQLEDRTVSLYHYRVTFNPSSVIPDIDLRSGGGELLENMSEANQ